MTKKHFEAFADYIRHNILGGDITRETAQAMADMVAYIASQDNPRFDRARFFKACGL